MMICWRFADCNSLHPCTIAMASMCYHSRTYRVVFKLLPKNVSLARSSSVPSAFMVMVYCNSRTTIRHRKNFLRLGAQRRVILTHQLPMLTQERAVSKVRLKSLQQERYSQNGQRKLLAGSMRRS